MSQPLSRVEESTGTEEEYLRRYKARFATYDRPGITADIVLFTVVERELRVLLIQRRLHPFQGRWALPGGFILRGESAEAGARRELREEAGVEDVFLEQLYTFSAPGRDPREWIVSVAHYALVSVDRLKPRAGTDATHTAWFSVREGKGGTFEAHPLDGSGGAVPLAFDHAAILTLAMERIRGKLDWVPIGFQLLPEKFTLTELQEVHEAILAKPLDKRNFRAKVLRDGLVKPTKEMRTGNHRPAQLFRYAEKRYRG